MGIQSFNFLFWELPPLKEFSLQCVYCSSLSSAQRQEHAQNLDNIKVQFSKTKLPNPSKLHMEIIAHVCMH